MRLADTLVHFFAVDRYLGSNATNQCEILHDGRAMFWLCLFPFGGNILRACRCEVKKGALVDSF